jgi:hypothetical protein
MGRTATRIERCYPTVGLCIDTYQQFSGKVKVKLSLCLTNKALSHEGDMLGLSVP